MGQGLCPLGRPAALLLICLSVAAGLSTQSLKTSGRHLSLVDDVEVPSAHRWRNPIEEVDIPDSEVDQPSAPGNSAPSDSGDSIFAGSHVFLVEKPSSDDMPHVQSEEEKPPCYKGDDTNTTVEGGEVITGQKGEHPNDGFPWGEEKNATRNKNQTQPASPVNEPMPTVEGLGINRKDPQFFISDDLFEELPEQPLPPKVIIEKIPFRGPWNKTLKGPEIPPPEPESENPVYAPIIAADILATTMNEAGVPTRQTGLYYQSLPRNAMHLAIDTMDGTWVKVLDCQKGVIYRYLSRSSGMAEVCEEYKRNCTGGHLPPPHVAFSAKLVEHTKLNKEDVAYYSAQYEKNETGTVTLATPNKKTPQTLIMAEDWVGQRWEHKVPVRIKRTYEYHEGTYSRVDSQKIYDFQQISLSESDIPKWAFERPHRLTVDGQKKPAHCEKKDISEISKPLGKLKKNEPAALSLF